MNWLDRRSRRGLSREGAERVSAGCYGSIVAASTLAGSAAVRPAELALLVVATNLVYFGTHVFAYSIGDPNQNATIGDPNLERKHLYQVARPPRPDGAPMVSAAFVRLVVDAAAAGGPRRRPPPRHQYRCHHRGLAAGACGTPGWLPTRRARLGAGTAHGCDPGADLSACRREGLAHALTRRVATPEW